MYLGSYYEYTVKNLRTVTGLTLEFQNHNNITYSTGASFLFGDNSNRALQFNVGVGYKF